jgi:hypothetical protein
MENRFNFIIDTFKGIGLGLYVATEDNFICCAGTLLCFQFYFDWQFKK